MKIAVIQASTQTSKNKLIFEETKRAVAKHGYEVFNFGVTAEESELSYIQVSLAVGLLLNSGAVDFVVTGCSSGAGMLVCRLPVMHFQMSLAVICQLQQMRFYSVG
ncbi:RpiB/LacA/LacB family sugar-phosphate isomerase [Bacillus wiedmannii]|uniref:RpiB/LacA/LacB family sugar-phosphate isomerase n=1 Tax=Bacillus wiedmannii TaxID=1890302 RepID=UPI0027BA2EB5|nr:RpiB/LacA/LacB family sugar-phosphate isomerase [Bacillus wiedmannii]